MEERHQYLNARARLAECARPRAQQSWSEYGSIVAKPQRLLLDRCVRFRAHSAALPLHVQRYFRIGFAATLCFSSTLNRGLGADQVATPLPDGVKAVWDLSNAYRETTPTRERICLNGLWQWQPAEYQSQSLPASN